MSSFVYGIWTPGRKPFFSGESHPFPISTAVVREDGEEFVARREGRDLPEVVVIVGRTLLLLGYAKLDNECVKFLIPSA